MSTYKEQLKYHLSDIKTTGNLLCVGNQGGDDSKYFKHDGNITTLDYDISFTPDIIHDMNKLYFENGFELEGFNSYDVVTAIELWEYIYDPVTAHQNIRDFLKTGGIYIGSYPFVYPVHEPKGTDYLRYTPDAIKKYLTMSSMKLIGLKYRTETSNHLRKFYQHEQMRARKDMSHDIMGIVVIAEAI